MLIKYANHGKEEQANMGYIATVSVHNIHWFFISSSESNMLNSV